MPSSIWNNILYYIENEMEVDEKIRDVFNFVLENELILQYDSHNYGKRLESITVQLTSKCNFRCFLKRIFCLFKLILLFFARIWSFCILANF